ncbi:deoxyribose-phosphate aldolase [Bacillaceae bacterium SIJ1]|uniref:deoxyribose-phosphate aldolase n=1 Tax=Litoribacterium kuwaitense TaxID=1398745 RepID=UPI0013ECB76E|nr:deoxyribose-phosphate aldolase [Litoribacterium kuwaitense]NGP46689.1 deoxyribose-phosphate aldolase [Litoribacterium kuwaitense]
MKVEKYIDHTLLKADATLQAIENLCKEAAEHHFASVCINPTYVKKAKRYLQDTDVKVCTVIGFPLGANVTDVKIYEAKRALLDGAMELDYVLNVSDVKNGHFDLIEKEMSAFVALKEDNRDLIIKVILETCYLTKEEVSRVCDIARQTKVDFVKTSTGFGSAGATEEMVSLMKTTVGADVEVKASGGIRTRMDLETYINLGATRIGTSNGVAIVSANDQSNSEGY